MKLWLDDVRPAPDDSWVWVKTVEEARLLFEENDITVASLDHDLGEIADPNFPNDPDPVELTWDEYAEYIARRELEPDGIELVKWMVCTSTYPTEKIVIHSWNPVGAMNMQATFEGCSPVPVVYEPFSYV